MSSAFHAPTVGRWRRVAAPTLVAGGVMGASVLLHLRDPHESGSYLYCPWLLLTGTYCPGCGGLRAVNDLTHGDVRSAVSSNLLLVGSLPLLVYLWGRWFTQRWQGVRRSVDPRWATAGVTVLVTACAVFWVVRNLGLARWLAP